MEQEGSVKVSFNSVRFSILLTMLFSLLGYFVYGSINGALAILLLCIVCNFMLLISVIPFVGWLIQAFLMKKLVITGIAAITGISLTWLTSAIFWVYLVFGIIISTVTSIVVLTALRDS
ncbi:hypothetical protein DRN97_05560 [Methanosarcinales archaeon]|nr:MAG: hypothetical protein DRN97_05560 [Methanosarcinales archaeon]